MGSQERDFTPVEYMEGKAKYGDVKFGMMKEKDFLQQRVLGLRLQEDVRNVVGAVNAALEGDRCHRKKLLSINL